MNRRRFLQTSALAGAAVAGSSAVRAQEPAKPALAGADVRSAWVEMLSRIVEPVLTNLAENRLKARMPVEARAGREADRRKVTHLEAVGRALAGLAPWIGVAGAEGEEEKKRARYAALSRQGLANIVDSTAADHLDFTAGAQCLVDSAFLALGVSRARAELWEKLDAPVRRRLVAALQSTRRFKPGRNNWLLFSATVEAFLASIGEDWKAEPIATAFAAHEEWFKGDGAYGDGPPFHWDYYNSFVIHPLLLATLELIGEVSDRWNALRDAIVKRAIRYAAVQERMIAPDGSYPPLGRSITYRCGAFHHLALMALLGQLPEGMKPAQVRGALDAVIRRTLSVAGTFDEEGWLRIGLAGHQPSLGESYISTGSLYLCTFAFLPLGLPQTDDFWIDPASEWTSRQLWSGVDQAPDHAV